MLPVGGDRHGDGGELDCGDRHGDGGELDCGDRHVGGSGVALQVRRELGCEEIQGDGSGGSRSWWGSKRGDGLLRERNDGILYGDELNCGGHHGDGLGCGGVHGDGDELDCGGLHGDCDDLGFGGLHGGGQ